VPVSDDSICFGFFTRVNVSETSRPVVDLLDGPKCRGSVVPGWIVRPELVHKPLVFVVEPTLSEFPVLDPIDEDAPHPARRVTQILDREDRAQVLTHEDVLDLEERARQDSNL